MVLQGIFISDVNPTDIREARSIEILEQPEFPSAAEWPAGSRNMRPEVFEGQRTEYEERFFFGPHFPQCHYYVRHFTLAQQTTKESGWCGPSARA